MRETAIHNIRGDQIAFLRVIRKCNTRTIPSQPMVTCMQEAIGRVQGAARLLELEGRGSRLASLQRQLVARRCRLAVSYGAVYCVGPKTGPAPGITPRTPCCCTLTPDPPASKTPPSALC